MTIEVVILFLVCSAAVAINGFVVAYTVVTVKRGAPWWRNPVGWWIFGSNFSLSLLTNLALLRRAVGEWPGYEHAATLVYFLITLMEWYLLLLLWALNRNTRKGSTSDHGNQTQSARN